MAKGELTELIRRQGRTLQSVADATGIHVKSLSRISALAANCSLRTRLAIAAVLGVGLDKVDEALEAESATASPGKRGGKSN